MDLRALNRINELLKEHASLIRKIEGLRDTECSLGFVKKDTVIGTLRDKELEIHVVNYWGNEAIDIEARLDSLGFDINTLPTKLTVEAALPV